MKKILMATTGIVAAVAAFAMVAPVPTMAAEKKPAEPLSLSISGSYQTWFGHVVEDNDGANGVGGWQNLDLKTDNEIHFKGSTTLDNGLKISATFEMEGDTANTGLDEAHLTISGAFGSLTLGEQDPVTDQNSLGGTMGGIGLGDGQPDWVRQPAGFANDRQDTTGLDLGAGDNTKINYSTPSINGLSLGLTYTPVSDNSASGTTLESGAAHNIVGGSVRWGGTFGAKDSGNTVNFAISYMEGENADDETLSAADMTGFQVGGNITSGNVTVGAAFLEEKNVGSTSVATELTERTFAVSLSYVDGASSYSIGYMAGTQDVTGAEDQFDVVQIAYNRSLGAGVTWGSTLGQTEFDGNGTGGTEDNVGIYVVTGITVAF